MNNQKILETLQMQPLSEDEKSKRHILGRLYGPIATCEESTRNGRKYNRDLWEKALADDIVKEKVANKSLFLELGHPIDREETDMEKVCACIPELPKIVDGDLYAYVDILDTTNGRLLKTLVDYGFIPGISSRGSGDIMDNNEVDPETFFLETWDIVQLPAVKKARLAMCESVDQESLKLRKALVECINSSENKTMVKEALENLHIELGELTENYKTCVTEDGLVIDVEDHEEPGDYITEAADEDIAAAEIEAEAEADIEDVEAEEAAEEGDNAEIETKVEDDAESEEAEATVGTIADLVKELEDFDQESTIAFTPIIINDAEYTISNLSLEQPEDGKVLITLDYTTAEDDKSEAEDNIDEDEKDAKETEDEENLEDETTEDEATDDEISEVIENLKDAIRQKSALEEELKVLRQSKTVSDTKVKELNEQLAKYKNSFGRVCEIAAQAGELEANNKALSEQLRQKETTIMSLKESVAKSNKLTESVNNDKVQVKELTEKLNTVKTEAENEKSKLVEQCNQYKDKLTKTTAIAKNYKAKYESAINNYIDSKAAALGVNRSEITSKLQEGYTIADVDKACDQLMDCTMNIGRLPITRAPRVQMQESAKTKTSRINDPDYGYEIDDDLLRLAGLK